MLQEENSELPSPLCVRVKLKEVIAQTCQSLEPLYATLFLWKRESWDQSRSEEFVGRDRKLGCRRIKGKK